MSSVSGCQLSSLQERKLNDLDFPQKSEVWVKSGTRKCLKLENESRLFTLPAPTGLCTQAFIKFTVVTVLKEMVIMPTQTDFDLV